MMFLLALHIFDESLIFSLLLCVTWNVWSLSLASYFSQHHFVAIISFRYFLSFKIHVCNGVTWKRRCGFFGVALRCLTSRWCWCFTFCACWLHLAPFIIFCFLFPSDQQCDELKRQSLNQAHQKRSPKKEMLESQSSSNVRIGDQLNKR